MKQVTYYKYAQLPTVFRHIEMLVSQSISAEEFVSRKWNHACEADKSDSERRFPLA